MWKCYLLFTCHPHTNGQILKAESVVVKEPWVANNKLKFPQYHNKQSLSSTAKPFSLPVSIPECGTDISTL